MSGYKSFKPKKKKKKKNTAKNIWVLGDFKDYRNLGWCLEIA